MAVIKLNIYVANLANVMGLFDRIQVERSESGEGGPYVEITASSTAAATLLGTGTAPFTLNGLTLKLKVDAGSEQTITFVTADPINVDDVVDFINANLTDATASEDASAVRITSDTTGTSSLLEITGGTALTELGFTSGDIDNGEDARITLQTGITSYEYDDQSGDPDNYYRTRFYNSSTQAVSSYSDPVKGDIGSIISASNLILAKIDLASLDGTPLVEQRIHFYNKFDPLLITEDIGVIGRTLEIETDLTGHAETLLVKGSIVNVSLVGIGIIREITVPSSGTEFDLMDSVSAADDLFQAHVPDIPAAVRRA